jgi:Beta-lactamase enzyme family
MLLAIFAIAGAAILLLQTGGSDDSGATEQAKPSIPAPATSDTETVDPADIWRSDAEDSWVTFSHSVPALLGIAAAPLGPGSERSFGQLQRGHAWSSIKIPILVTRMRETEDTGLDAEESAWAREALTESDNAAAASLFDRITAAQDGHDAAALAVQSVLGRAGDHATTIATAPPPPGAISTYGQSLWSLGASTAFFRSLGRGCLLGPAATEYATSLMEEVIPEQRWGLGEATFPARWQIAMKGGWGPEGSSTGPYLVRQSGLLRNGKTGIAVAMMAQADSGSFEDGVAAIDRLAEWLRANLRGLGGPMADC